MLQRLAEPAQVGDHRLRIGASIGIAFHPKDGQDGDALLKHADIALYAAKAAGRGTFRSFDVQMTACRERAPPAGERPAPGARQPRAGGSLPADPRLATPLEIAGFEALARWRHPTRGYIRPDIFIRIAEECGLINRLGRWVLEQACTTAAAWKPGMPDRGKRIDLATS